MKKPASKVEELREALKAKKEAEEKQKHGVPQAPETAKPPEPVQAGEERKEEDISGELQAAEKEARDHYEKLLRLMAEFENYKKRASREKEEHLKYANEKLIKEILPVLDDFDRLLSHVSNEKESDPKTIVEGVELIRRSLLNALQKFELSEIEAFGKQFDPNLHEAVSCVTSEEHEDGVVIEVHRKGYKLADRVIRAAQVVVSKKSS
jgi:molecular chaperone GrpE